jgi:hypothetical protein
VFDMVSEKLRCTEVYDLPSICCAVPRCCYGTATMLPRWCREVAAHLLISETD